MHVLTSGVMEILANARSAAKNGSLALTPALSELAIREKYLAYEVEGRRYNLGQKFGLLNTQLALGLAGNDREEILSQIVEVLATRPNAR
jgi:UTP--glucose-1-phosphate uridylyltransferase